MSLHCACAAQNAFRITNAEGVLSFAEGESQPRFLAANSQLISFSCTALT